MPRPAVASTAAVLIPPRASLTALREAAHGCRACPLWKRATQTVFGAGPKKAALLFVGEQPGNEEDLAGKPFIGPAGRILAKAMAQADIPPETAYVTNVVKHFKWEPRGKRRIHAKPSMTEIAACIPWLEAEIALVEPRVLVCLGATAARALLGPAFRVSRERGRLIPSPLAPRVLATVHPSSILRAPDDVTRRKDMELFVADLKKVRSALD